MRVIACIHGINAGDAVIRERCCAGAKRLHIHRASGNGAERAKHAYLLITGAMADMVVAEEGPMVVVAIAGARITITVAAPLAANELQRVVHTVQTVSGLDAPGLQRRYRDILLGRVETAGGLELSLMDLARRSMGGVRCGEHIWKGSPFVVLEVDV